MVELDTDLFGSNTQPLAAYIEPEGYQRLTSYKRNVKEHFNQFLPVTLSVAQSIFGSIHVKTIWGKQTWKRDPRSHEDYSGWHEEHQAHSYRTRGTQTRPGKPLSSHEVLRSLCYPNVYALGRTDQHDDEMEHGYFKSDPFRTTQVDVLLIDIDMDSAWTMRDDASRSIIRHELAIEHEIATKLGLSYRAFRTGRRGHQIVIPLPLPVNRSVASWLMYAYIEILRPYHIIHNQAHADKHNLMNAILRVVGGRHAANDELALWIDPDRGSLYQLDKQVDLMQAGYKSPVADPNTIRAFGEAADEIGGYLFRNAIPRYQSGYAYPHFGLWFYSAIEALQDNILCNRFNVAREELALSDDIEHVNSVNAATLHLRRIDPPVSSLTPDDVPKHLKEKARSWAQRIWEIEWIEGSFWTWISENGDRGITAAKILFGDQALNKLIERTYQYDGSTPRKASERRRVIQSLYEKHKMLGFGSSMHPQAIVGELPQGCLDMIPLILSRIASRQKIQQRNLTDFENVIKVLLLGFELDARSDDPKGYMRVSLDALTASIKSGNEDSEIDRSTVSRIIQRLTQDHLKCGYALVEIIKMNEGWSSGTYYRPGSDLRETPFGSKLPKDELVVPRPPITKPLITSAYRIGSGKQVVIMPRGKRGRKRKES